MAPESGSRARIKITASESALQGHVVTGVPASASHRAASDTCGHVCPEVSRREDLMSLGDLLPVLQDWHRTLHESLTSNLGALQDAGSPTAFISLVAGGF